MSLAKSCKSYRCRLSIFWVRVFAHISLICPLSVAVSFTGFSSHPPSVLQPFHLCFWHWGNIWKGTWCQSHFSYSSHVKGSVLSRFFFFFFLQRIKEYLQKPLKESRAISMNSLANKKLLQHVFSVGLGGLKLLGKGVFCVEDSFFSCVYIYLQLLIGQRVRRETFLLNIVPQYMQGKRNLCKQTFAL